MFLLLEKKIEENIKKIAFVKSYLEIIRCFLYRGWMIITITVFDVTIKQAAKKMPGQDGPTLIVIYNERSLFFFIVNIYVQVFELLFIYFTWTAIHR